LFNKPASGLLNKSSFCAPVVGLTKFANVRGMSLVTLCFALKSDLDVQQTHLSIYPSWMRAKVKSKVPNNVDIFFRFILKNLKKEKSVFGLLSDKIADKSHGKVVDLGPML
jgi:hypothetical protein